MAGYFKVSMDAARAIVEATDGPELLAGYITVCGYAFGSNRGSTAAGAKAIRQTLGCTDHRSKRIMADLRSLRFGERGELGLLTTTRRRVGNAAVHNIEPWEGEYAYLPALLIGRHPEHGASLAKALASEKHDAATIRDALLLLLHVYARTDYGEWFGCPPDAMAYQHWKRDGYAGDDFELGLQGMVGTLSLWLVGKPDDWTVPKTVIAALFGQADDAATARFWAALWCLRDLRQVVDVVSVQTGGRAYPLWVYSVAYRDSLRLMGITPDIGKEAQLAACDSGLDPDNNVIRYAIDELDRDGSGLFYCVGANPTVRTVIVPRLHAPTPVNMDGLTEAGTVTKQIWRQLRQARRLERAA